MATKQTKNKRQKQKKIEKTVKKGRLYIAATFNNTLITATDPEGNVIGSGTAGSSGFKGARRATPYAATKTVLLVLDQIKAYETRELEVFLKGAGSGREAGLRALKNSGMKISLIADITPMPHNGVRPKKKRRV
jgi:small subunit ribosomal protein S11